MSGAAIAGAGVQLQSANRTVLSTTESDMNGDFTISGLSAGNYRLVVSHAGFEAKEIPVAIGAVAPAPFRISLALGSVSTTVNVKGREGDLTGIAQSATQGTVGQMELEDRPILRSGEILETVPGVIITQHNDLTSDGMYRSKATILLNAEVSYQISKAWRFSVEFLNLLNASITTLTMLTRPK